jgi:hypothetical protein
VVYGRKVGAQPGNRNALKHAFYSDALTRKGRNLLRRAAQLDPHDLEQEIALLRSRIHVLVAAEPDNLYVLTLAGRLLVKMIATHYGLSLTQETGIHESLKDLIQGLVPREV